MSEGSRGFDWGKYAGDRWSPEGVGDEIVGTITGLREEDGRSGVLPVLALATPEGEREVWAGQVHLQQQLARKAPEIGDRIAIQLTDLRNTGQPSPIKIFSVKVERATASEPDDLDEGPF